MVRGRARGDHPRGAERLAAHVVAVERAEVGFSCRDRPVVEADRDDGGVEVAGRLRASGATRASANAWTAIGRAPGLSQHSVSKSWMSVSKKIVHWGMRAGSPVNGPGSRVSERSSCGVPMRPASIAARAAANAGAKRRLNPTCSTTPACSAAAMARSASARVTAIGFSQNTCLPAAAAATTRSVWLRAGAVISTPSTSGRASSVSTSTASASRLGGQALRVDLDGIGDGDEPGARHLVGDDRGVVGADAARADEREAERSWCVMGPH